MSSSAAVAVGHCDQHGARIVVERELLPLDLLRPRQEIGERLRLERLEDEDAGAREERGVELEGRVLGGGADQRDGAVLHHRQEGVLLGAVEAVDFVDEEERPLAHLAAGARRLEGLLEVGDAGEDGRNLLEMEIGLARREGGRRLSCRSPAAPRR